jgi:hypothetical protein
LVDEDDEIFTLLQGEDATDDLTTKVVNYLEEQFEDLEVEVHQGKQPIYSYIFSVE